MQATVLFQPFYIDTLIQIITLFELILISICSPPEDVLDLPNRPRPLAFDPDQHKILNSELKQLYTAITRARVNVWIFDEEPQSRAPMFEYFKARRLVQCMGAKEEPLSESELYSQVFSI